LAKEGRPEDPFQVTQYVRTHSNLGYLKYRQGRYQEAEENLREALRMSPGYLVARNNLGLVLRALGRTEEALTEWRNALAQSANPASCRCLAGVLAAEGREAEAIVYLERGLEIQPDAWDMMIDLAWLLAGSEDTGLRDPARALALATKVQAALPQESVKVWDVLGMVRAAQKDFKEAAVCAERALRLGRKRKMAGLVKIEERLLDYQRHLKDAGQTAPAPNESNSREEREE
jgi:tetratricopeptide (TPR) repeat protein